MEERSLLVGPTRSSESRPSSVKLNVRLDNKNVCACKEKLFPLHLYHIGHFNVDALPELHSKNVFPFHYNIQIYHKQLNMLMHFKFKEGWRWGPKSSTHLKIYLKV